MRRTIVTLMFPALLLTMGCDDDTTEQGNAVCGNGIIEEGEVCDGTQLNNNTCVSLNAGTDGQITCNDSCQFDTSACVVCTCGDGILCGAEQCDLESFGDETCETQGDFSGGTLTCADDCTIETGSCIPDCAVEHIGRECDPQGGTTECCPIKQPSGEWEQVQCHDPQESGVGSCLPLPEDGLCGWSLAVDSTESMCDLVPCGEGNESTPINAPCTLGSRSGWCQPSGAAMDQSGTCLESGTKLPGEVCNYAITWDQYGIRDIDPDTQCLNGVCANATGDGTGVCISYCDPVAALSGNDSCPQDWNCANWSWLEMGDLSENTPQYFRGIDYGLCMPMISGISESFVNGAVMCDVLTGLTTKEGVPCPTGEACFPESNSHTLGMCSPLDATPLAQGDVCTRPGTDEPEPCDAGLYCSPQDPFNDPDMSAPALACMIPCDATVYDNNTACAGLQTSETVPRPFVCLTTSRYYTPDNELPTWCDGQDCITETAPSTLGFCVPPAQQ